MSEANQELKVTLDSTEALLTAYMPYVYGGGLFIPTASQHALGDQLNIVVTLPDKSSETVSTKVVWVTPKGAQGNRAPGIGCQLLDDKGAQLDDKIRNLLGDKINEDTSTHTL